MSLNLLTNLAFVKNWAGITTSGDDTLINQLIGDTSRFILSYLQRPTLFQYIFSDLYDGNGGRRILLRHWPVLSVALVTINDITVTSSSGISASGYQLEPWDGLPPGRPQTLNLRGYDYCAGYGNVTVTYTAGFVISGEMQTVPATAAYTIAASAPHGAWGADQGVSFANGTPLVPVSSSPAQGQYSVSSGTYSFAAADANKSVMLSYSYVPSDIAHACMSMVVERYRYRNRIGEISKSLGGQETMSFTQKDMPDFIRTLLQPYRRVIQI